MRTMPMEGMVALLAVLLVGLVVFPACTSREKAAEKMAENMIEKATGGKVDVDLKGQGVKIATKEGDISWGETAEWPEDIPGDVPRFTQGKVTGVVRAHGLDAKNWNLALSDVEPGGLANYAERLKAEGWDILSSVQMADVESVTAQKGGMSLTLGFNKTAKAGTFHVAVKAD